MAHTVVAKKISANMNMCEGPLLKKIIMFSIPLFFTSALQLLFNTADLIIVGRSGNPLAVAAVGSTSSLIHLIVNLFMGLSSGIGVVVATAIGGHNEKTVEKTVHTSIPLAVICGAIVNLVLFCGAEWFLTLMGSPREILELSAVYLKIYACGMIPNMVYNFCAAILRAQGDTLRPLMFLSLSGIINVVLNFIFVVFCGMDVDGVALATSISQVVSAILVVIELMNRSDSAKLCLRKMRIHYAELQRILRIGLPAGIQGTTFSISNVIIQSSVNSFGAIAISGSAAAASIGNFAHCGVEAFQQTSMNFAGQNYGARKLDRVKKSMLLCMASVVVFELLFGGLIMVFSKPLLSLYISDSKAIGYGITRLALIVMPYFIGGMMQVVLNIIRGMGHSFFPMVISIFSNCVFRILWIFTVFAHFRESSSAWTILYMSYPISWTLAVIMGFVVYYYVMKKERKALRLLQIKKGQQ